MKKVALTLLLLLLVPAVYAGDGIVHKTPGAELVKDSYIVLFHAGEANPAARANELAGTHGGTVNHVYRHALLGAHFLMTEGQARGMAQNPHVARVQQEGLAYIVGDQSNPTWGIDRIDERDLPDDNNYHWDYDGTGVTAFILDTGIRTTHVDFGGRASWGTDCTGEGVYDGHGHGTHVAGTVGSATYGVAKNVTLVAVKICNSGGSCPSAAILCGIDYATGQKQASPSTPMVANMSIGGSYDATMNNAVTNSVAAGIFYAVAAGNNNANACNYSPASTPNAYTLGATTSSDARSSFSNWGTCVDIFAPGSSILSTYNSSDTATATMSGTSMASPHACGAGALVLDQHPTWTPYQAMAELDARATLGRLSSIGTGSPNALLYTLDDGVACTSDPECDDGAYCNGAETCNLGTGECEAGTPVVCDDGVGCTDDSCNESTDSCDYVANDANCTNGLWCDGAETCHATLDCQAGTAPDCSDGVGCTDDSCNESTDSCDHVANDASCDNGLFCDGAETCDPVLDCQAGSDPCPGQGCDEGSDACTCLVNPDCDDGVFCNGVEVCNAGVCEAGTPPDCSDGVGCTDDSCNTGTDSCQSVANHANCDNGLFCDGAETCDPALDCQAGSDPCPGPGQGCDEVGDVCTCVPTENPEVSCSDGLDNDCDGLIDGADPDCAPACKARWEECDVNSECCSGRCLWGWVCW